MDPLPAGIEVHEIKPKTSVIRPFRVTISGTHKYSGVRFVGRFILLADEEMDELAVRCWPVEDDSKLRTAILKQMRKDFHIDAMRDLSVDLIETLDGQMFALGTMAPEK